MSVYRERREERGEAERLRERLNNECFFDVVFWDQLLQQTRSCQYIERGERREEKQKYYEKT